MDNKHLIYRVIEYGLTKKFFTYNELNSHFKFSDDEVSLMKNKLINFEIDSHSSNSNHIIGLVRKAQFASGNSDYDNSILSLLPTATFEYNDYLEIVEARKSANEAKRLSWYAIWISIGLGVVQIVISYLQLK